MHFAKCVRNIVQSKQLFNTWRHSLHVYTIVIFHVIGRMARAIEPYIVVSKLFSLSLTLLAIFII